MMPGAGDSEPDFGGSKQMHADGRLRAIPGVLLAGLLLALMAVLAGGAALRESVTVDEVSHIGAGVSYLQKLDLRRVIYRWPSQILVSMQAVLAAR